ncbi:MAG: HAD hydrolase-like protein [Candidatus Omnitrophica bacterium]|nr:HAD hydrolase-like protein [Candidatus Omnitrophota bacterium]
MIIMEEQKFKNIKIDSIFFDLDGTLVDSKDDIVEGVNYTLKKLGLESRDYEEIVLFIGGGVVDLIEKSVGKSDPKTIKKGVDIYKEYFSDHLNEKSTLYPGVKETIKYFKDKNLVVVTNRGKYLAEKALKGFGIIDYFKGVVGGDDEECLKPLACPINKGFEFFKGERERSMMVGDMVYDILAGKAAGVITCGVTYGIGKEKDLIEVRPDYMIDSIAQLKNVIIPRYN